jgi:hypothetical protein
MIPEQPNQSSELPANKIRQTSADDQGDKTAASQKTPEGTASNQATVIVRGETVRDQSPDATPKESSPNDKKKESPRKVVSEAKAEMQGRLPALEDDSDVGIQKEQVVVRDGKADLAFTGTLVASVAPPSAPGQEHWGEYRIYETDGGKHVFSKVIRSVFVEEADRHEAEVFEPSPSSVPAQLLRSARDLTRSRPIGWTDAAVTFYGYGPLAKTLYRKLGDQFEEHIS